MVRKKDGGWRPCCNFRGGYGSAGSSATTAAISLVTDASAMHVDAVLQQRRRGQPWKLLGFFSQKLSVAESQYSAFDRELCIFGIC
jgi:RNase H-like domain found in reverse transcriptase